MCTEVASLSQPTDRNDSPIAGAFDVSRVNAETAGTIFHNRVHHFSTIGSTQFLAIADAQAGAKGGQVYVADEQTAGRGRGGHTWHSEPDRGLYITALVRPSIRGSEVLLLSFAAGLASQRAVAQVCGIHMDLRWPNDLVTPGPGSLKLGGILTETALQPDGLLRYAAIGIGINLNQTAMPTDLEGISTSLLLLAGKRVDRSALAAALLLHLSKQLDSLLQTPADVLQEFENASSWVRGKHVTVAEEGGYTGVTDGLTEAGLLRVRCANGSVRVVRHGGVREAA